MDIETMSKPDTQYAFILSPIKAHHLENRRKAVKRANSQRGLNPDSWINTISSAAGEGWGGRGAEQVMDKINGEEKSKKAKWR